MELIAHDFDPVVARGEGTLEAVSPSLFTYEFKAYPDDLSFALQAFNRLREKPYDGRERFRLIIEDDNGVEFNAGWTIPKINVPGKTSDQWTFSGECDSLVTQDSEGGPFPQGSTEVRFTIPRKHYMWLLIRELLDDDHELEMLGTTISAKFDRDTDTLTMSAPASDALPQPYAENWLGEPLRILFGQLVFPRLVARSFGARGGSQIWVRPSPNWSNDSNWIALWKAVWTEVNKEEFWAAYAAILSHVAMARDEGDHPNFETNKLTHLYEEIIQATRGSRWVWALTIASSIEGLLRTIVPEGTKRSDADLDGIQSLTRHIYGWDGDKRLKRIAAGALSRDETLGPGRALRNLASSKLVRKQGIDAWESVRHKVMHGNLVSPYSTERDDRILQEMAGLLHSLTIQIVQNQENASRLARRTPTPEPSK